MLIVRLLLSPKRDSTTQTPRPAIILRAFLGGEGTVTAPGETSEMGDQNQRLTAMVTATAAANR
jgi:hypothetical protein